MESSRPSESQKQPGGYFLLLLLVATLYATYRVISPYLNAIFIATALSLLFYPVHNRILMLTRGRRTVAALCSCTVIIFLVIVPLFFLGAALIAQGVHSFNNIYKWLQGGGLAEFLAAEPVVQIRTRITQYLSFVDFSKIDLQGSLLSFSKEMGQFLLSKSSDILSNVTRLVMHFLLLVFTLFYFLKEGQMMVDRLFHLLPLSKAQEHELIDRIIKVIRSTVVGAVLTAVAQGVAGGIGLAFVGFPALFWGTVMAFASLIPIIGTALIWVPAALYLGFSAGWKLTVFFVLWNLAVVGSIDNFLRPYLIGGESGLSPLLIFFAILGGVQLFGFIGILYGPLIFGLCGVLLYLYELEHKDYLNGLD